jgi:hypothetical protein
LVNLFIKKIGFVAGFVLVLFLIPAFVSYGAENEVDKTKPPVRMAIIPFQAVLPETETGNTVVSPLSGAVYFGGKIAKDGEKIAEELFIEKMKDFKEVEVIPQEKVAGIYKRVSAESLKMPLSKIIRKAGVELNADLVVAGYVFRYAERIGYGYSAEKAASVAFEINFVNPKDGRIIWRGVFDRTQKSLMEDVFHVSSLKWLTVRELAKQGMKEAFKSYSGFEH